MEGTLMLFFWCNCASALPLFFTIAGEVLSLFFPLAKTVCTSFIVYCACHMQPVNAYTKHSMTEGFCGYCILSFRQIRFRGDAFAAAP